MVELNISVYQCISVQNLKIGSISNSSVFQMGTSGKINALSHNYESNDTRSPPARSTTIKDAPLVPLPAPTKLYPR
ncbi:spore germination protein GerPB [Paenibacillus wynnii]|uniref:spore germination protein GerPB n=1 Tax=Paenibacillus wynnii TaxID=268407 RepID=UPI00359393B0